jgi:cyanate permease
MAITRSQIAMIVTLPWLAAGVVLLAMTRIDGETQEAKLGLFGSAAICFSIGCLARTSLGLHDLMQASQAVPPTSQPGAAAPPPSRPPASSDPP